MPQTAVAGGAYTKLSPDEARALSRGLVEKLASSDPMLQKEAVDSNDEFIRMKMRDDSWANRVFPPETLTRDRMDRVVESETPMKIIDIEPDSPGAVSVGYGKHPEELWMRARRFRIAFERIMTRMLFKDIGQLLTWSMDFRQISSDLLLNDLLVEVDSKTLSACDKSVFGEEVISPVTGFKQNRVIGGKISRDSWIDGKNVMQEGDANLVPKVVVMNQITHSQFIKFDMIELGGDMAQKWFTQGMSEESMTELKFVVTIKKHQIPNFVVWYFADPEYIGRHYTIEQPTMYVKREYFMIWFFFYMMSGMGFANLNGICKVRYS